MTSFYFEFKEKRYQVQASICNDNGSISCEILGILNEHADLILLDGMQYGLLQPAGNPLMAAVHKGFNNYLKNFPVDHLKSATPNSFHSL